jgi:integrase
MEEPFPKRLIMLLTDFFTDYYIPRRLRGKSERSTILYKLCIKRFTETIGKPAKVADLTEDNLLKHLARRSLVAPATRNKELAELTAMWRLASQRGFLKTWPDVQPEPEPERAPIAWLASEMAQLFAAIKKKRGYIAGVPESLWWEALVRLTLDTGERISAVRVAKWDWIQGEWALVPAEARKGKTRDRRYRLGDVTHDILRQLRLICGDEAQIFPWPYSQSYLWNKYNDLLQEAKLPETRKHKFHALRKTSASVVHAAGLDATDCLDHSDRRTTQRYLDPRFVRTEQPCDVLATYLASPASSEQPETKQATA